MIIYRYVTWEVRHEQGGWPSSKGCKVISKPHPRHTQESSQICHKNNHKDFSNSCTCILPRHRGFSNSGTCALDAQLCPQVTLGR